MGIRLSPDSVNIIDVQLEFLSPGMNTIYKQIEIKFCQLFVNSISVSPAVLMTQAFFTTDLRK
jgi:hypothetical protein